MSRLVILIADDIHDDRKDILRVITESAIGKNCDLLECECAETVPLNMREVDARVAVDVIRDRERNGQTIDLAFIDLVFNQEYPTEDDTGGKAIVEALERYYPDCRVIIVSKNASRTGTSYMQIGEKRYAEIAKDQPTKQVDIINRELRAWTERFIRSKVELVDRMQIKAALDASTELPSVTVGGEVWRQEAYLMLYPGFLEKAELYRMIQGNLTHDASACFGVNGVKQITHRTSGYYIGDFVGNMKAQLVAFNTSLSNMEAQVDSKELPFLGDIRKCFNDFREAANGLAEGVGFPVSQLTKLRKSFRFGSSRLSTSIVIGAHLFSGNRTRVGTGEFEIYLAIHKLYEQQFTDLASMCDWSAYHSNNTGRIPDWPCTWEEGKQPVLHRDYLIFGQTSTNDADEYPFEAWKRPPDYLDAFQGLHFSYFGNIYFVYRQDGQWQASECTFSTSHRTKLDKLGGPELQAKLGEWLSNTKALFIFEFIGWRQPR